MANPWVAVPSPANLVGLARTLARAHDTVLGGGNPVPGVLRAPITESWRRCTAAGIDPEGQLAPVPLDEREVADRWTRHPLHGVMDRIRAVLSSVDEDAHHLLVVTDADGHLMLVEGDRRVMRFAENMNFVPGALWSEEAAGTNAPGTTLAVGHPIQVFSAEHFSRVVHPWTCVAAPVRDPETGELLGALDLTGGLRTAHPHSLCLVTVAAQAAEAELRTRVHERDRRLLACYVERLVAGSRAPAAVVSDQGRVVASAPGHALPARLAVTAGGGEIVLPDGSTAVAEPIEGGHLIWIVGAPGRNGEAPRLELDVLGGREALASLAGVPLRLGRRHSEILALLALHPQGLTGEELALALYGDEINPVTARAEMSRLRVKLGTWLAAKPYRLLADVRSDLLDVQRLVADGRLAKALERYRGPLLPWSDAPGIVAARERLDGALRRSVLDSRDPELLWRWTTAAGRDGDRAALRALAAGLPPSDPRRGWALTALADDAGARRRRPA